MTYLALFYEFFKIGLFAVGGGLATIPFLYDLAAKYTWFTTADIANMIAISESTPGPIGINMATFAGFNAAGILGSICATVGIIIPEMIIVMIIAGILTKFKQSSLVKSAFYGIRPAVCALISAACIEVIKISILRWSAFTATKDWSVLVNYKALIAFAVILFLVRKFKKHPILYIALGAVVGIVLHF
jgi:chromate transporter